jgi:hypothetical protein
MHKMRYFLISEIFRAISRGSHFPGNLSNPRPPPPPGHPYKSKPPAPHPLKRTYIGGQLENDLTLTIHFDNVMQTRCFVLFAW